MNQQRLDCERLIYKVMEALDDPKKNGNCYKEPEGYYRKFYISTSVVIIPPQILPKFSKQKVSK